MNQKKKRIILKLWGWISLGVNCLVMFLHLAKERAEFLIPGIFLAISTIGYGIMKTKLDKRKGDISITPIVIEYVCVYLLTFIMGFKLADELISASVLISLMIASLIEMLLVLLFTYWRPVYRFFYQNK